MLSELVFVIALFLYLCWASLANAPFVNSPLSKKLDSWGRYVGLFYSWQFFAPSPPRQYVMFRLELHTLKAPPRVFYPINSLNLDQFRFRIMEENIFTLNDKSHYQEYVKWFCYANKLLTMDVVRVSLIVEVEIIEQPDKKLNVLVYEWSRL